MTSLAQLQSLSKSVSDSVSKSISSAINNAKTVVSKAATLITSSVSKASSTATKAVSNASSSAQKAASDTANKAVSAAKTAQELANNSAALANSINLITEIRSDVAKSDPKTFIRIPDVAATLGLDDSNMEYADALIDSGDVTGDMLLNLVGAQQQTFIKGATQVLGLTTGLEVGLLTEPVLEAEIVNTEFSKDPVGYVIISILAVIAQMLQTMHSQMKSRLPMTLGGLSG